MTGPSPERATAGRVNDLPGPKFPIAWDRHARPQPTGCFPSRSGSPARKSGRPAAGLSAAPPPPVADNAAFWVYENHGVGTSVGTVTASDVVPSDVLTYAITAGNTGGAFSLNSLTGQLTVAAAIDFANIPSDGLTVAVTDGLRTATAAGTFTQAVLRNHWRNQRETALHLSDAQRRRQNHRQDQRPAKHRAELT